MGKLVASIFVSLDNLVVAADEDMSWVVDNFDPEMGRNIGSEVMNAGDLDRPDDARMHDPGLAERDRGSVTGRGCNESHAQARLLPHAGQSELGQIRQRSSDQQMTDLGLIDEYVLWLHPVILGRGKPLFKDNQRKNLNLVKSKAYASGVALTLQPKNKA